MDRLVTFIEKLQIQVYSEAPTELHGEITGRALEYLSELFPINSGMKVLDVGCGQGPALDWFKEQGFDYRGVTLSDEEIAICRARGFVVDKMDQSFLDYPDEIFDLLWARHVLEHSPFPLFTLEGFRRVLKPGGMLYVEVPAPDTISHHEKNPNHYSVFCKAAWIELLGRSGFKFVAGKDYFLEGPNGSDQYWGFYVVKLDSSGLLPLESYKKERAF